MAEAIQQLILDTLDSQAKIKDTRTLVLPGQSDAAVTQDAQITILGALNSLLSREVCAWHSDPVVTSEYTHTFLQMVTIDFHETLSHVLTREGAQIALEGSHEARVWNALPVKGEGTPLTAQQLQQAVGKESASVGQGRAFKAKWIGKEGDGFIKLVCFDIEG